MKYALTGRSEVYYGIGDTVKLYNGTIGEVTQRHNRKVTLKLYDDTVIEAPEHYIVGVVTA